MPSDFAFQEGQRGKGVQTYTLLANETSSDYIFACDEECRRVSIGLKWITLLSSNLGAFLIGVLTASAWIINSKSSSRYISQQHEIKEAYATLLCTRSKEGEIDWYFYAARLFLHRMKIVQELKDPNRPVIVITTKYVESWKKERLSAEGAIIKEVEIIDGPLEQHSDSHSWIDQFTKLNLWSMIEYERILYVDSDVLYLQSPASIWQKDSAQIVESPPSNDIEASQDMTMYPWLFAACVDRLLWDNDRSLSMSLNAGLFKLHPNENHKAYLFNTLYNDKAASMGQMDQSLLKKAYRQKGPFPWRQFDWRYNANFPSIEDVVVDNAKAIHHKFWWNGRNSTNLLTQRWYRALDEMTDFYNESRLA